MSIRAGTRQRAGAGTAVPLPSSEQLDHLRHIVQLHPQGIGGTLTSEINLTFALSYVTSIY